MSTGETKVYEEALTTLESTIVKDIRQRRRGITIDDESVEDVEAALSADSRDQAIREVNKLSLQLKEVRMALQRIKQNTYGVCLECEEDITPKRLAAVPWAKYCVKCQDLPHDEEGEQEVAPQTRGLLAALAEKSTTRHKERPQKRNVDGDRPGDNTVFDRIATNRDFVGPEYPVQSYTSTIGPETK